MNAQVKELIRSDWNGGRGKEYNRGLSDREWEVMLAISNGESPASMALRLGLSVKTVSTYRARILQKAAAAGWRIETAAQYLGRVNSALTSPSLQVAKSDVCPSLKKDSFLGEGCPLCGTFCDCE